MKWRRPKVVQIFVLDVIPQVANFGLLEEGPQCRQRHEGNLRCPGKCSLSFEKSPSGRHRICGIMDTSTPLNVALEIGIHFSWNASTLASFRRLKKNVIFPLTREIAYRCFKTCQQYFSHPLKSPYEMSENFRTPFKVTLLQEQRYQFSYFSPPEGTTWMTTWW